MSTEDTTSCHSLVNDRKVCLCPLPKCRPPHVCAGSVFRAGTQRAAASSGSGQESLAAGSGLSCSEPARTMPAVCSWQSAIASPHTHRVFFLFAKLNQKNKEKTEFTANINKIKSLILQGLRFLCASSAAPRQLTASCSCPRPFPRGHSLSPARCARLGWSPTLGWQQGAQHLSGARLSKKKFRFGCRAHPWGYLLLNSSMSGPQQIPEAASQLTPPHKKQFK